MSTGRMVWKDKHISVRDVVRDSRLDEGGVRDGWLATADGPFGARMFYPCDMFAFEADVEERS